MNKTSAIDLSADRLIAIAADLIEEHNYIGALKMLNKNAVLNGNDEDSFMLYAEAFDDMGLYEKCINGWFKYIDYAGENANLAEAYEGLAVSYMNLGQENFAAYYYNKLLIETNTELSPENRREIIKSFVKDEKPTLRFAWPPRLADFSDEIDEGIKCMRANDYNGAVKHFMEVDKGNEKYYAARNYIAMCDIITDNLDLAEAECNAVLQDKPDDVQALTSLAAIRSQQNARDEAVEIAKRLLALNLTSTEDIYKTATVCCENHMHEEAYKLFCILEEKEELQYDCSLLFFKAIAAYNSGRAEESVQTFDKLLTIYNNAIAANYWKFEVLYLKKRNKHKELDYFYRLPADEREMNVAFLSAFNQMTDKQAKKVLDDPCTEDYIRWCFDEGDASSSYELHLLGALSAVKAKLDDMVRDILLDAFLEDAVKMETISALVQDNTEGDYGVVICNILRNIKLIKLEVGKLKHKYFMRAYAYTFSRFAMLSEEYGLKFNTAATKLYYKLEQEGRLADVKSVPALAAAILISADVKESALDDAMLTSFFGVTRQKVNAILGE